MSLPDQKNIEAINKCLSDFLQDPLNGSYLEAFQSVFLKKMTALVYEVPVLKQQLQQDDQHLQKQIEAREGSLSEAPQFVEPIGADDRNAAIEVVLDKIQIPDPDDINSEWERAIEKLMGLFLEKLASASMALLKHKEQFQDNRIGLAALEQEVADSNLKMSILNGLCGDIKKKLGIAPPKRELPEVPRLNVRLKRSVQSPPSPPSLGNRFRAVAKNTAAKWKALPMGWKILAGSIVFLSVAAIVVAAVFFPPTLAVTLPVAGKVAATTIVATGGVTLAGATGVGHGVHVAVQKPPVSRISVGQTPSPQSGREPRPSPKAPRFVVTSSATKGGAIPESPQSSSSLVSSAAAACEVGMFATPSATPSTPVTNAEGVPTPSVGSVSINS